MKQSAEESRRDFLNGLPGSLLLHAGLRRRLDEIKIEDV